MSFKRILIRVHSLASELFGVDLLKTLAGLSGLPAFFRGLAKFRDGYCGKFVFNPYSGDRYKGGVSTKNEYFWQDLLVAQRIFQDQPSRHVDVGSRIDGFVAHVANFRHIDVFNMRLVTSDIPGVVFKQANLMFADSVGALSNGGKGYCDSLSCLHAIEHFGLGRYGDPVDPLGYRRGIENRSRLLLPGGRLYLSNPIGSERVEYNANWVFDPNTILGVANAAGLRFDELTVLHQQGGHKTVLRPSADQLNALVKEHYRLGIFHFIKESGK